MIFKEGEQKKALREYEDSKRRIQKMTTSLVPQGETIAQKEARKTMLLSDFEKFAKFYFPQYCQNDFAWFHKKFIKTVKPNELTVLRWFRGSAKSVFVDLLFPTFKYFRGEMTGMVIASDTAPKAAKLLGDIQNEFENNALLKNDFGDTVGFGSWTNGYFSTANGHGFYSFGVGQSPRGIREGAFRPNYFVCDDVDSKDRSKNPVRVQEAVEWIQGDLFRAADITANPIFVVSNNAYSKHTVVRYIVGDVEPSDPKRTDINLIEAFAIENPKNHARAELEHPLSICSWHQRFTKEHFRAVIKTTSELTFRREDQQESIEIGHRFKNSWLRWTKKMPLTQYEHIVAYLDPSYKDKATSDFKAIAVLACYFDSDTKRLKYKVIKAFCRQTSKVQMVKAMYDIYDWLGDKAEYWMEANFIQADFREDFEKEGVERGYQLPLMYDRSKKDEKTARIENLTADWERGDWEFCESQRQDPDMIRGIDQFMSFPTGKDDFPDAAHGAKSKLRKTIRGIDQELTLGKFIKNSKRR